MLLGLEAFTIAARLNKDKAENSTLLDCNASFQSSEVNRPSA